MTLTCWPIQFLADPMVQEARNVGGLLSDGPHTLSVFMGDKRPMTGDVGGVDGHRHSAKHRSSLTKAVSFDFGTATDRYTSLSRNIESSTGNDSRYFCRTFGFEESSGWIYHEWREWFRSLARDCHTIENIQLELDSLSARGQRFVSGTMFDVLGNGEQGLEAAAWKQFAELVRVPNLPSPINFNDQLEYILRVSELTSAPNFHRDIELEIFAPTQPTFVRFPGFIEAPVAGGIKTLRFRGATEDNVAAQVNDIVLTFGVCVEHGIMDKAHCVILHDEPSKMKAKYLARVENVATLIPIFSEVAPKQLATLFQDF